MPRGLLQRLVRRNQVHSVRSEPTCRYVLISTPEDRALVLTSASSTAESRVRSHGVVLDAPNFNGALPIGETREPVHV